MPTPRTAHKYGTSTELLGKSCPRLPRETKVRSRLDGSSHLYPAYHVACFAETDLGVVFEQQWKGELNLALKDVYSETVSVTAVEFCGFQICNFPRSLTRRLPKRFIIVPAQDRSHRIL